MKTQRVILWGLIAAVRGHHTERGRGRGERERRRRERWGIECDRATLAPRQCLFFMSRRQPRRVWAQRITPIKPLDSQVPSPEDSKPVPDKSSERSCSTFPNCAISSPPRCHHKLLLLLEDLLLPRAEESAGSVQMRRERVHGDKQSLVREHIVH